MISRPLVIWFTAVCLLATLALPSFGQTPDDAVERLTRENRELRAQVATLTAELEALRQELAALRADHVELTQETESLEQQVTQQPQPVVIEDRAASIQAERIQTAYDQDADRTVVTFGPEELEVRGSAGSFYFSIVFNHAGAEPQPADEATLFLQAYRAGRQFDRPETVAFEIDGEPTLLPVAGYDVTPRKTGQPGKTRIDRSDEVVGLELSREALSGLGEARSLSMKAGRGLIVFDQDELAAMRAVAQRMGGE